MDNAPGIRFISLTFVIGFGLGAFVGVGLALLAVALTRPEDEPPRIIEIPAITASPTPEQPTAAVPDEPTVRAAAALTVRVGPGGQYATLGTIARGDPLDVVGRDFDSEWLAIRFPPGSNVQGWVPAMSVEGLTLSSITALAVLLPTPLPIEFTTPPPFSGTPGTLGTPGTGTPDDGTPGIEDGTPDAPAGTTDLSVLDVDVLADGHVEVTVFNGGPSHVTNQILSVTVRSFGGRFETLHYSGVFLAGTTLTFTTSSFTVGGSPENVQIVVDPSSSLNDPNRDNNVMTMMLSLTP